MCLVMSRAALFPDASYMWKQSVFNPHSLCMVRVVWWDLLVIARLSRLCISWSDVVAMGGGVIIVMLAPVCSTRLFVAFSKLWTPWGSGVGAPDGVPW